MKTEIEYYDDEPIYDSKLFRNDEIASSIKDLILYNKLHTPFAICINGEWGEGKTSLLGSISNKVEIACKEPPYHDQQIKMLRFNAWEFERLDPVAALLYRIQDLYTEKDCEFKETAKNVGMILFDMAIRAHTKLNNINSLTHIPR